MTTSNSKVVGIVPWLPWPFSASPAWTQPVRAERLAVLRIGLALCLFADIAVHYAPETMTFFATGSLGDPAIHGWRFRAPRMSWSVLRGVGDPVIVYLSLTLWIGSTVWILGSLLARLAAKPASAPTQDRTGIALSVWTFACLVYALGIWSNIIAEGKPDKFLWAVPLVAFSLACMFVLLDLASGLRDSAHRILWRPDLFALLATLALVIVGFFLSRAEEFDKTAWWARLLRPWQDDQALLITAMGLWLASTFLLMVGCRTRFFAVMTWVLAMSFGTANEYLDNAGDTIRMILLFYLMLCPSGAALSIDAWWTKAKGPVYVSPWPIRLIFVQMMLIYFMNGVYKLFGPTWLEGNSLHYVLGDAQLTRFSNVGVPLPIELTRLMSWSVLIWEVTFPLMAMWKWPRRVALFFGVMFHLGIFASMELAFFVPYALCMYLPLIPWPKEREQVSPDVAQQEAKETGPAEVPAIAADT